MTRFAGIFREPAYSPGRHLSNDARLLERVAAELRSRGITVGLFSHEQAIPERPDAALLFSMCQGAPALHVLEGWEHAGARIINAPRAALNTHRTRLLTVLADAGIRFPVTRVIQTAPDASSRLVVEGPHWLKRGDVHASVSADVQFVEGSADLPGALAGFAARGIRDAVLQEHLTGAEIKFYGVGTPPAFFHCYFSRDATLRVPDVCAVRELATRAARAAGLDIYGGDIMVEPSGELTLIDLNDWPSFAPCLDGAAPAIADYLMRHVDDSWPSHLVSSTDPRAL